MTSTSTCGSRPRIQPITNDVIPIIRSDLVQQGNEVLSEAINETLVG